MPTTPTGRDLDEIDTRLDALETKATAVFGSDGPFARANPVLQGLGTLLENQVGHALDSLLTKGASLHDVLGSLTQNLLAVATQLAVINPTLNAAFGSTRTTLGDAGSGGGGIVGGLFTGLEGAIGGLFGGRDSAASTTATSGGAVNVNISTPDAQSFAASSGQVSAGIADAVRRGQRLR